MTFNLLLQLFDLTGGVVNIMPMMYARLEFERTQVNSGFGYGRGNLKKHAGKIWICRKIKSNYKAVTVSNKRMTSHQTYKYFLKVQGKTILQDVFLEKALYRLYFIVIFFVLEWITNQNLITEILFILMFI